MRWLALFALTACWTPTTIEVASPQCPVDQTGCALEVGFTQEQLDKNPCRGVCRKWADQDLDAAVNYLCHVPPGRNTGIDNPMLVDMLIVARGDPQQSADALHILANRCGRDTLDRVASDVKLLMRVRPAKDWTPVRQAARDLIKSHGPSEKLEALAIEPEAQTPANP